MSKKQNRTRNKRVAVERRNKCAHFKNILTKLKKLKGAQRVQALQLANSAFLREFCSHVKKLRHVKLSPSTAKKLKRHSKILRKLIHKNSSINVKRKILTQRGGGILLPLIGALIPTIAAGLFGGSRK